MRQQLEALGATRTPDGYILNLNTDNNDLSFYQVWITESLRIEKDTDIKFFSYDLKFEWSGLFEKNSLEVRRSFIIFELLYKCIEDFKKFHKDYL